MPKAVIFDLDGVIVNTTKAHYFSWSEAIKVQGGELLERDYQLKMSGRNTLDNARILLGEKADSLKIQKLVTKKTKIFLQFFDQSVTLVKGAIPFISALKKKGVPIALATSARKEISQVIFQKFSLSELFTTIVTSDDVTHAKPHPEIFLKAAKKLGIKPSNCLVFEDSHSGVEAAKKAGMKVILVMTSHTRKDIPNADLAIKDFTQITIKEVVAI